MKLQGLIFDMDGTLGDTVSLCIMAMQRTFQQYEGRAYTSAEIMDMFGYSEEGMLKRHLPETWPQAVDMYIEEYERGHVAYPEPFSGIPALLTSLRARGLRMGIVTGKGPRSARISAHAWKLDDYFSGIETGAAGGPIKPLGMRAFLTRWGLAPQAVAYVGDAASDIAAAREAGVLAVAAAWAGSTDAGELAAHHPDALFRTVADFAAWVEQVSR